jgi:uncharacterized protein YkwD
LNIQAITAVVSTALMLAGLPRSSAAGTQDAVNWARLQGCGASTITTPLYANARLERAAKRYAAGATLQSAVAESGYLAAQSAAIHLSGPSSDAEIERMLAAHDCGTLQDPKLREFGAERRGRELWLVLAAPIILPDPKDAAAASRSVLTLVNEARAAGQRCGGKYFTAVGPLALDAALTRAALEHSRDMAAHDAFDHRGHDGSTPAMRVDRAGFGDHRIVGENIAAGAMTPGEVTQGWLASPAHCANIMDGRFTLIGIAYAENLHTRSAVFWTQDFAAHR